MYRLLANAQVRLHLLLLLLQPLHLVGEPHVVLFEPLKQLFDLPAHRHLGAPEALIRELLLQFVILLAEDFHIVLE